MSPPSELSWMEIDLKAVKKNYEAIRNRVEKPIISVLKANAYGLGAGEIGRALHDAGCEWFAVARFSEAEDLRKYLPDSKILILGPIVASQIQAAVVSGFRLTVHSKAYLQTLVSTLHESLPQCNIHIKIETGFGRLGIMCDEIQTVLNQICGKGIVIEGVYSHYAMRDVEADHPITFLQDQTFQESLEIFKEMNCLPDMIHMSNSASAFDQPEPLHTHVRVGTALFGLRPHYFRPLPKELSRCFSWHSTLISCKHLPPNHNVGYGSGYLTKAWEWIGVVPIGYSDGYRRSVDNHVIINGLSVPVVGSICSDYFMIKLPYEIPEGTEVLLIGHQDATSITVDDLIQRWHTSQAEVISAISQRVIRKYL